MNRQSQSFWEFAGEDPLGEDIRLCFNAGIYAVEPRLAEPREVGLENEAECDYGIIIYIDRLARTYFEAGEEHKGDFGDSLELQEVVAVDHQL